MRVGLAISFMSWCFVRSDDEKGKEGKGREGKGNSTIDYEG